MKALDGYLRIAFVTAGLALAVQVGHRLMGQPGIDRAGAKTNQAGKAVRIAGLAALAN